MDVYDLLIDEGPVALLRIFLGCIPEETTANGLLDPHCSFATRYYIQFVSEEQRAESICVNVNL